MFARRANRSIACSSHHGRTNAAIRRWYGSYLRSGLKNVSAYRKFAEGTRKPETIQNIEEKRIQIQARYVDADECVETPSLQEAMQAFGHILSEELPMLYRRAYRFLGNQADAEDALHDALLAAYTHLNQFRGKSRMSTWMTAIVHNSARMQLRTRRRHLHVPLDDRTGNIDEQPLCERLADHRPSPEHETCNSDLCKQLMRVQCQLSPRCAGHFSCATLTGYRSRRLRTFWEFPPER